jgi:Leucine-rich repeat (LRR) protein
LSDNPLVPIESHTFQGLENLYHLEINNVPLHYIADDVFTFLSNLNELSLNRDSITEIASHALAPLVGLLSLSLTGNLLTQLPFGIFAATPRLNFLFDFLLHHSLLTFTERLETTEISMLRLR